jgi:SWI/SNF-related matrix-associated actin-dependent regulator of chromatin subfamily A member 5
MGAKSFYGDEDKDELSLTPIITERIAVRQQIASVTAAKRNQFFVDKKDYFLPLLPAGNNFVKKLVEKHDALSQAEKARIPVTTPYEEIESQPRGITAIMKPYQLSGLSFLVYLHRNGLSGILGDEMGLGKTLQTLSLIQYLKENEPKTGAQLRPFLVVCPLSVLSSWMAEARKWAPGLKVLRFHGPVKERDRLKKIAAGEIDIFGNLTSKQKAKLKTRRTAAGKQIISLDSDSEPEEEVGVDLVVTTYESYQAEQGWFKRAFVWRYVVLDEGHKIKNDLSLISKALQGLQAEYRLILTGTPLQNNLAELWALLHWLYQDIFTDQSNELFRTSFDLTKGLYSDTVLDDSRHLLELIMLRRMKNSPGVDLNLPPKTEVSSTIIMTKCEICDHFILDSIQTIEHATVLHFHNFSLNAIPQY